MFWKVDYPNWVQHTRVTKWKNRATLLRLWKAYQQKRRWVRGHLQRTNYRGNSLGFTREQVVKLKSLPEEKRYRAFVATHVSPTWRDLFYRRLFHSRAPPVHLI